MDCDIKIFFPGFYLKNFPPIESLDTGKLKLSVSPTLESILDLDEVKSMIKLKVKLTTKWQDSRLTYVKMHPRRKNLITPSQKTVLWLPSLVFENTNDVTELSFDDELSHGMIQLKPNAKGEIASLSNTRKFTGNDGYSFHLLNYNLVFYLNIKILFFSDTW